MSFEENLDKIIQKYKEIDQEVNILNMKKQG